MEFVPGAGIRNRRQLAVPVPTEPVPRQKTFLWLRLAQRTKREVEGRVILGKSLFASAAPVKRIRSLRITDGLSARHIEIVHDYNLPVKLSTRAPGTFDK